MASESFEPIFARSLNHPFRRCVVNCSSKPPECPSCASDESCSLIARSCNSCADTICVKNDPDASGSGSGNSGPNVGAIAGGVIGALCLIAVAVLIWWFCIRKRRKGGDNNSDGNCEKNDGFVAHRRERESAAGSIASTVLTRASNVIQIAYIPGVTNRSPPDSPGVNVPPVPPIPAAVEGNNAQNQHYFMPGDIRDSVWSNMSNDQGSISPSLARGSMATSSIYRNDAIVSPMPAQQALRAKAAVVSVKPGSSPTSDANLSPIGSVSKPAEMAAPMSHSSSIVGRSGVARPINVTKPGARSNNSSNKTTTIAELNGSSKTPKVTVERPTSTQYSASVASTPGDTTVTKDYPPKAEKTEKVEPSTTKSKTKTRESSQSAAVTVIEDSPEIRQSPFADPKKPYKPGKSSTTPQDVSIPLGQSIVEPSKRSPSPFGDQNEIKS